MTDSRLKWQCRRGMRELDEMLGGWLEKRFPSASPCEQQAFRRLLALADDELIAYLLAGRVAADPELADVIRDIQCRTANR